MLHQGNHLLSELFNLPFGSFTPGSAADLVILDYDSPTPMTDENLAGHFLFGLRSSMVESVMVNGEWIIFEREWPKLDAKELYAKAIPVSKELWQKMAEID
ncbi:MAG: amidohydrolase family protein [Planctomycetes bacterium]|nr:amidohydrolase family protein [Planctomycetota bacterium]